MRIAITGASGLIGSALAGHLEAENHAVVRLRRGPRSDVMAHWDPGSGWVREGALDGVDAVVHLAGANIGEGRWTEGRRQELRASRVDSTRLLVEHLGSLAERPKTFISASAVGFYGDRGDELLTEEAGPGEGFLAGLVRDWENEAARVEEHGVRPVMLRFGLVIAKDGGVLPRMLLPFKLGVGGRLGGGDQWMSWVALEDAARAIAYVLRHDISGPVNVTSPEPVRNEEFTKALGSALRRPTVLPVPGFGLKVLFGRERARELFLQGQRVLPHRLMDHGYDFAHTEIAPTLKRVLRGGQGDGHVAATA